MQVKNKKMYHFHKSNKYNELWIVGNTLEIDDNFNTIFLDVLNNFNTAVECTNGTRKSFNSIINGYLEEKQEEETYIEMLKDASRIIYNTNIFKREKALEEVRQNKFSHLPSRKHSIWVTDKRGLKFLNNALDSEHNNLILFEVLLTGNLFKSSDYFLPDNELTYEETLKAAENYWNPNYSLVDADKSEYLFQGSLKIAKQLHKVL